MMIEPGTYLDCFGRRFEVMMVGNFDASTPFEIAIFRELGCSKVQSARVDFLAEVVRWPDGELKPRFMFEVE